MRKLERPYNSDLEGLRELRGGRMRTQRSRPTTKNNRGRIFGRLSDTNPLVQGFSTVIILEYIIGINTSRTCLFHDGISLGSRPYTTVP